MDITDQPEYIRKAFRRSLLEGDNGELLAANRAQQKYVDLRRYAFDMEKLIDRQEQLEVKDLTPDDDILDEQDRSEFWAWHYPVHWDQVVRVFFRASTVITIVSFLEITLAQVCRDVRIVTMEQLSSSDLQGGAIEKSRKYLIRFGGFSNVKNSLWGEIKNILGIRNALVHANGRIDNCRSPKKVRQLVAKGPGLSENIGSITIEKEYLEHCVECAGEFLSYLSCEMRSLCNRRKRFESDENS